MFKGKSRLILSFIFILFIGTSYAQEKQVSGAMDSPIPVDPNVKIGKLDNGLTYYIRKNAKPEAKAELRLVVNAGSILETEEQQGLAHFLEHMAFNGSENFEKNEVVNYLQSIGVKFGADLNAYTSFDETVYILPIPTDDEEKLEQGFQILDDMASGLTLSEEEIDKERGVILEERRSGLGAGERMRQQWWPVMFKGSQYSDRLPIGKKEVLESFDYEQLEKFYEDWYRPDLMAVVVVGDIDPEEIESKIKDHFGDIKAKKNAPERTLFEVPDHEETLVSVATDPEAPYTQIQLVLKTELKPVKTIAQYRDDIIHSLYSGMLNARYDELAQSAEPPYLFAGASFGAFVRTKGSFYSNSIVGSDGIEKGLKAIVTETERAKKYGFTQSELNRYKAELLSRLERAYNEADKTESNRYTNELVYNYLEDEPIPGIAFEYDFHKKVLPTITLEEVNAISKEIDTQSNRVVVVTGPEKEGLDLPNEDEVLEILNGIDLSSIEPYAEEELADSFISGEVTPGKVTGNVKLETVGAWELTLSNGARVVLKPTDFKNDEILLNAYSLGGESLYEEKDMHSANYAAQIVGEAGVADFSSTDIQKMLSGKNVSLSPFIGSLTEGMRGQSTPKDFETMLELVHLYFTDPRTDQDAFQSFKSKNAMLYGNLLANPQYYYSDQVNKVLTQNHPRGGGFPTVEDLEKIDYSRAMEIYKERFANAGDFTFIFTGAFNPEEAIPLIEKYIGSLPGNSSDEKWRDLGIRPPMDGANEIVNKGTEQQSIVTLVFAQPVTWSSEENYKLSSLGDFLTNKLIDVLREEQSGVYSVGASGSISQFPYERSTFRVGFGCSPDNVESLIQASIDEIKRVQEEGVSEEQLNKVRKGQLQDRKENLERNQYWSNALYTYYYNGLDLDNFYKYEERVENLSSDDLQDAAKKYLPTDKVIRIVLKPEE